MDRLEHEYLLGHAIEKAKKDASSTAFRDCIKAMCRDCRLETYPVRYWVTPTQLPNDGAFMHFDPYSGANECVCHANAIRKFLMMKGR